MYRAKFDYYEWRDGREDKPVYVYNFEKRAKEGQPKIELRHGKDYNHVEFIPVLNRRLLEQGKEVPVAALIESDSESHLIGVLRTDDSIKPRLQRVRVLVNLSSGRTVIKEMSLDHAVQEITKQLGDFDVDLETSSPENIVTAKLIEVEEGKIVEISRPAGVAEKVKDEKTYQPANCKSCDSNYLIDLSQGHMIIDMGCPHCGGKLASEK